MSHIFANRIRLDGQEYVVGFVLREDDNGNRFYDHELTKIIDPGSLNTVRFPEGSVVHVARANRGDVMNVLRDRLGVNDGTGQVLFQTRESGAPAVKDGFTRFHWLENSVELDGTLHRVGLMLAEDAKGNLFYNLNADVEGWAQKSGSSKLPGHSIPGESEPLSQSANAPGAETLPVPDDGVNLAFGGRLAHSPRRQEACSLSPVLPETRGDIKTGRTAGRSAVARLPWRTLLDTREQGVPANETGGQCRPQERLSGRRGEAVHTEKALDKSWE